MRCARALGTSVIAMAVTLPVALAAPNADHTASAAGPAVVLNELHFNPDDDDPAAEFVELYNTTSAPIDLRGWCLDGIGYCFGSGATIPSGGFVVRRGNEYPGALSNGGEEVALLDRSGTVVDAVEYDDHGEWPAYADGEGQSLQRRDPAGPGGHPGNWESAPPTPGARNANRANGLLPTFSDVEHTVLPAPGAPITVTAHLDGAVNVKLGYRIGLGQEVLRDVTLAGGRVTATIPGQPAGTLVRYRLIAESSGRWGTWPRQGDGSAYRGTTVARPSPSALPVFEFFMPDAEFQTMTNDLSLSGDDGYPMVFAYRGEVFDNARIRVKGQVSRTFPKKKYKIVLPPGYDLEDDDLFPDSVDEFAMHSAWSDRSFLRETLSSEFMTAAGARGAQQAFPVRFERNGLMFGLYTYVEQPDGTYRDRYDLDDSEVYEVGPDNLYGLLDPADANRSQDSLRARYDKETFEYLDDGRLRDFIRVVNALGGPAERAWIDGNVDIPSVVNTLAASMVIQNQDWGHKNYRLVFDQYGRVGVMQNDYDLTWGRRWSNTAGALDTRVYVGGAFEHPGGPFFETFFFDPELAEMVRRRIRTLTEQLLQPDAVAARVQDLAARVRPDAVADRAIWGTYGGAADPTAEATRLVDAFVRPQYGRLLGSFAAAGRVAATSQPAVPALAIEDVRYDGVEHVVVRNLSGDSVDISSFEIPELDLTVPGGTVLLPGRAAVFVHEDVDSLRNRYAGLLVAGVFEESVADAAAITLRNRAGQVAALWDLLPPRQITELSGEPNRSAIVSLVATRTGAPGYLQLHDCDVTSGATSNLNYDGVGQTRSTLALARFGADGRTCLFNLSATHAIADVQGYFVDGTIDDVADVRLLDTRTGARPGDGTITRIRGGRPNTTAVMSLVATETTGPGYLAILPCSTTRPTTSNLNWVHPNRTVASLSFVRFDANGEACVFNLTSTHVIADVQGYLADTAFDDVPDARLVDTRTGARPGDRSLTVLEGRPDATAIVSLVATATGGPGYLQVVACDTAPGATSNVNYDAPGLTVNGLTTVRFGPDGRACIYALTATDVVADIQGYFAPGAFDDVPDRRLVDTRER